MEKGIIKNPFEGNRPSSALDKALKLREALAVEGSGAYVGNIEIVDHLGTARIEVDQETGKINTKYNGSTILPEGQRDIYAPVVPKPLSVEPGGFLPPGTIYISAKHKKA